MIETNESLLRRLRMDDAHEAWKEFYETYWGAILRYGRKVGLSEHQSEDVLQETMVSLMRILPGFAYSPDRGRFRNFLLTIVHRKSLAMLRRSQRKSEVRWSGTPFVETATLVDSDGVAQTNALDNWREVIWAEALRRLQEDPALGAGTFAIFHAYVIEKNPAAVVARRFGVKENAIYQIKNRLMRRLQRDVAAMMRDSGAE